MTDILKCFSVHLLVFSLSPTHALGDPLYPIIVEGKDIKLFDNI